MERSRTSFHVICTVLLKVTSWVLADDVITVAKTTSLGTLEGYTETVLGRDLGIFLGIPFAKPPLGEKRFRNPEPLGPWSGTLDATKLPNSCPQAIDTSLNNFIGVTMWNPNTEISEDCLYLNIWAPSSDPLSGGRPVLVWIFGGGFSSGTSTLDLYDGRILSALGDIIVVSFQYRTGSLGFMYLGTEDIPGNMGLQDQVLALEWIQDNIGDYGGDPSRVTIFGESAGAVSVGMHLLSAKSQDLFQRAILQSSTPLGNWVVDSPSKALQNTMDMAVAVGCTHTDLELLTKCLLEVPHELFPEKFFTVPDDSMLATPLVPTIDGDFLTKFPKEIIEDNSFKKTEILLGVTKNEGAYWLPFSLPDLYSIESKSINTKEAFLKSIGILLQTDDPVVQEVVSFEYRQPYSYKEEPHFTDLLDDIVGDYCFKCSVVDFAKAYAAVGQDVYFYRFSHNMPSNPWPDWMGVLHGYEIDSVFGLALNESLTEFSEGDREFSRRVAQHWINFAANGDPSLTRSQTPTPYHWPTYTESNRNVLVLDLSPTPTILDGVRDRKCAFWADLVTNLMDRGESCHNSGCPSSHVTRVVMAASLTLVKLLSMTLV